LENSGVGEREGKIYSHLVAERNFGLGHGIGRSGDISALQPKALGSSLLVALTTGIVQNMLKTIYGLHWIQEVSLFPMATGMTLSLLLMTMKSTKPTAEYVIFSRIDQKTCLKCLVTSGLKPIIIDMKEDSNGGLNTDIEGIEAILKKIPLEKILCVFSVSSCFAPRNYDNIPEIAKLCKNYKIYHVVNNAFGLQCTKSISLLNEAIKIGNIDALVSSFDKNFLVPVGGALIYSPNKDGFAKKSAEAYPGRASISPILDLCITLLEMGKNGLQNLLKERKEMFEYAKLKISEILKKYNEQVIELKSNKISIAFTLSNLASKADKDISEFGSYLYTRRVSGIRIVMKSKKKSVCGIDFDNYGSHIAWYSKLPYMTFAVAIGCKKEEVFFMIFLAKLKG